jgi:hypothetical protein
MSKQKFEFGLNIWIWKRKKIESEKEKENLCRPESSILARLPISTMRPNSPHARWQVGSPCQRPSPRPRSRSLTLRTRLLGAPSAGVCITATRAHSAASSLLHPLHSGARVSALSSLSPLQSCRSPRGLASTLVRRSPPLAICINGTTTNLHDSLSHQAEHTTPRIWVKGWELWGEREACHRGCCVSTPRSERHWAPGTAPGYSARSRDPPGRTRWLESSEFLANVVHHRCPTPHRGCDPPTAWQPVIIPPYDLCLFGG